MTHLPDAQAAAARLAQLYEQLAPARLAQLDDCSRPEARFKDPFNDVQGVPAIRAIFAHMFESLEQPRFVVTQHVGAGAAGLCSGSFTFA